MNQNFNNEPNFGADEAENLTLLPEYAGTEQPVFDYAAEVKEDSEVNAAVDKNFGKALAAAIMAEFPITSIISIFFGHKAWKTAWSIDEAAKSRGARVPGKNIASKILSAYGKGAGIACTVLYALLGVVYGLYFLLIIFMVLAEM